MKHPPLRTLHLVLGTLILLCAIGGCRRSDVREFTIAIPTLSEADKPKILAALAAYDGVRKDSYAFDLSAHTLTLKYDSMKIARMNILQAIEGKGVKVVFPEVKGGYAGYVNEKIK